MCHDYAFKQKQYEKKTYTWTEFLQNKIDPQITKKKESKWNKSSSNAEMM